MRSVSRSAAPVHAARLAALAAAALLAASALSTRAVAQAQAPAPPAAQPQPTPPAPTPRVTLLPVPIVVDAFESTVPWSVIAADGVSLKLAPDSGAHGKALRLDFDFHGGGGYAVARRAVSLDLPANWRFTFRVRGEAPPNNLEFKLIDTSGDNVWWCNTRDYGFPRAWTQRVIRRRDVTFAWGPLGGGEPAHIAYLEFAVSAGQGGRGSVWLDDLELQFLPPPDTTAHAPLVRASSEVSGRPVTNAIDGKPGTYWGSEAADTHPWLAMDLGAEREFGGLVLDWMSGEHAIDYWVETSSDRREWRALGWVRGGNGDRDWLSLPESEGRYLRLHVRRRASPNGVALANLQVMPLAWSETTNDFLRAVAKDSPAGAWPRATRGELAYWTVVGQDFDSSEGLLDEYGRLESGKRGWSVEPFLWSGGRLRTWADMTATPSLADGCLPVPSVDLAAGDLRLRVTSFATGAPGASSLVARYRLRNAGSKRADATLFLAVRPLQVNAPSQFLNTTGGFAPVRTLAIDSTVVRVNGDGGLACLTRPAAFGATSFQAGDISEWLREGRLPPAIAIEDSASLGSGALSYPLSLAPGEERDVAIEIPLHAAPKARAFENDAGAAAWVAAALREAEAAWRERLGRVTLSVPAAPEIVNAMRAQLGWVLVNRDGPSIQPGSRSYERSWIRDGCLTSSALLRLGETEAVRQFIEWFAPFQYPNGKVPCCADLRGADPVPEHDSHGELVYLIAEYTRYTGDLEFARRMWPHVAAAVAYLDTLRAQRRGPEWRTPENARFFGMLPPSISHEGYSSKPMHSYWDGLFALRGYKDAAWLAGELGMPGRSRIEASRDTFERDLVASYRATMRDKGIDWLAGCADLGDFDATSTSIALDPVGAEDVLPDSALRRTFERYWEFFERRRLGKEKWEAFTPYEWRNVGAFVRLGWRDRALSSLDWFMGFRRPRGFEHWAEVCWKDERRASFIGDMPHTWVGTDYARTVLNLFAYEHERDSSLVLAAGVPPEWLADSGVVVRGLRTRWGPLAYTLRREPAGRGRERVTLRLEKTGLRVPPGGVQVPLPPLPAGWSARPSSTVCAEPVTLAPTVTVRALPAEVTWEGPQGRKRKR